MDSGVLAVVLNRIRERFSPLIDQLAIALAKTGISPLGWTILTLLFSIASSLFYGGLLAGGATIASLALIAAGVADLLDGAVARATGRVSSVGAFMDSNADRMGEVAVYIGIIQGGWAPPSLVTAALALSLLVSYARARAEALGLVMRGVGVGERAERLVALAVFSLINQVAIGVTLVLLISGATFVHRLLYAFTQLRAPRA